LLLSFAVPVAVKRTPVNVASAAIAKYRRTKADFLGEVAPFAIPERFGNEQEAPPAVPEQKEGLEETNSRFAAPVPIPAEASATAGFVNALVDQFSS
jgi:hypothetical protein